MSDAMTMVWAANRDNVEAMSGSLRDVRLVENLGDAAAWMDREIDEQLVVIGPDVRFIDVAAFAGYVRGLRRDTALVLIRHPEEADVAGEARVVGVAEVVCFGAIEDLERACQRVVVRTPPPLDREPTAPTAFRSRRIDSTTVTRLDAPGPAGFRGRTGASAEGTTVTIEASELLATCVRDRLNVVVTGDSGAGKTTLLASLAGLAPTRDPLLTVDSGTARDVINAMNNGRRGSLTSWQATSPRDALAGLEAELRVDTSLPLAARAELAAAVDVLVHIALLPDGTRRVTHVTEVRGIDSGAIATQDRYRLDDTPARLTG